MMPSPPLSLSSLLLFRVRFLPGGATTPFFIRCAPNSRLLRLPPPFPQPPPLWPLPRLHPRTPFAPPLPASPPSSLLFSSPLHRCSLSPLTSCVCSPRLAPPLPTSTISPSSLPLPLRINCLPPPTLPVPPLSSPSRPSGPHSPLLAPPPHPPPLIYFLPHCGPSPPSHPPLPNVFISLPPLLQTPPLSPCPSPFLPPLFAPHPSYGFVTALSPPCMLLSFLPTPLSSHPSFFSLSGHPLWLPYSSPQTLSYIPPPPPHLSPPPPKMKSSMWPMMSPLSLTTDLSLSSSAR